MATPQSNSTRWFSPICTVAGFAALALAIYLVAVTPPSDGKQTFDTASEFVREGLTMAWLAASIAAVQSALAAGVVPKVPSRMISAGYGLIFIGVAIGVAMREDPDWFLVLGAPGQLLSMAGFVIWAVRARRAGTLGVPLALLCGVGGVTAILGAEMGLTVLIAAFWLGLARTVEAPVTVTPLARPR